MNEKWNQEKESKKRMILVEKLVEKNCDSQLYCLPCNLGNAVKSF